MRFALQRRLQTFLHKTLTNALDRTTRYLKTLRDSFIHPARSLLRLIRLQQNIRPPALFFAGPLVVYCRSQLRSLRLRQLHHIFLGHLPPPG